MPYTQFDGMWWGQVTGTTSPTVGTTTTHAHSGGVTPKGYIILSRGNGVVYEATSPDAINISVRGSAASIPFTAMLFY